MRLRSVRDIGEGMHLKNLALRVAAGLLFTLAASGLSHIYAADGEDLQIRYWDIGVQALILGILLLSALLCILYLRRRAAEPLKKLRDMTDHLREKEGAELQKQAEKLPGLAGETARAIAEYVVEVENDAKARAGAVGPEEAYKQRVVDEICRSLLPMKLKESSSGQSFALTGGIQEGVRRSCALYDYFYLDENTLCMVVGQVPGSGIAEALFAVVAQTAIRSRLRMGRSLTETMSDVNAQLFDLGGMNTVCALVAVLNTVSGQFSYVNAGSAVPFLMRSEERYEWLRTPVYAALGANESVSYRSETLRLNQGDRLFLFSADLGELSNREGEKFQEQEFQSVLNRSRSKTKDTEELLRFVQDEAAAFCESGNDVLVSAELALEYKRGNRDYVFTLVEGKPEFSSVVTEFLRKTLEEGGLSPRDRAKQLLLADELFALCCRVCESGADIKVACAVFPEENSVHLRMFAPLGGKDPMTGGDDAAAGNAANYISTHTRRVSFEPGIERDMIEIVSDLT